MLNVSAPRVLGAMAAAFTLAGVSLAARGDVDPATAIPPLPQRAVVERLNLRAFSAGVFTPLVTYRAPSLSSQNKESLTPTSWQLCSVLPGDPPKVPSVAIVASAGAYLDLEEGEDLAGDRVRTIGDGFLRLANGTTLVESACDQTTAASQGAQPVAQFTPSPPSIVAPPSNALWVAPQLQPTQAPALTAPTLYGSPIPDQNQTTVPPPAPYRPPVPTPNP